MEAILIIASNVLLTASTYAVAWHAGKRNAQAAVSDVPEFVDTRLCLCGHKPTTHRNGGAGNGDTRCTVLHNVEKYENKYTCACTRYIPDPKAELV